MEEVAVKNNGKNTMYCGGFMIPPGETRILPSAVVPAHLKQPPAPVERREPSQDEAIKKTLALSVKDIAAMLPDLTLNALGDLEAAEESASHPRKTLLSAIQEERLRRAADNDLEEFRAQTRTMSAEELLTHAETVADNAVRLNIIQEQIGVVEASVARNNAVSQKGDGKPGSA
jgi:hypothetical protein